MLSSRRGPTGAAARTAAPRPPGHRDRRVQTCTPSTSFPKLNATVRIAVMDDSRSSGPALGAYVLPGRVTDPGAVGQKEPSGEKPRLAKGLPSGEWGNKDLGVVGGAIGQVTVENRIASG